MTSLVLGKATYTHVSVITTKVLPSTPKALISSRIWPCTWLARRASVTKKGNNSTTSSSQCGSASLGSGELNKKRKKKKEYQVSPTSFYFIFRGRAGFQLNKPVKDWKLKEKHATAVQYSGCQTVTSSSYIQFQKDMTREQWSSWPDAMRMYQWSGSRDQVVSIIRSYDDKREHASTQDHRVM